ncbi:MAG: ribonuclease H-like domain-containing protein [Deltaproteobacteria bacterium]|nr:ribonuclease H-like domain-containing protein [Deltaproteobacteria bacterium]
MLEHTFIHIQGIGEKTERRLWRRGIRTWQDLLNSDFRAFPRGREHFIREALVDSFRHRHDIRYFRERLPVGELWRLYDSFREKAVYLDIETSGGHQGTDEITVIGIYDGRTIRSFVSGMNLSDFEVAIADYDLIITFNGTGFDLPCVRRSFPNITLPATHIDLRFLLKKLGYRGGLKKIEKEVGIQRENAVDGMDGFDAVRLWRAHLWGDPTALDLLIRYNTADIVDLEPLAGLACQRLKARLLSSAWEKEEG